MTTDEYITHFSFWAAFKSPLLIGTDLSRMSADTKRILLNRRVISVNQDPLMTGIQRVANSYFYQVWSGPLSDGSNVMLVLNIAKEARNISVNLRQVLRLPENIPLNTIIDDLWSKNVKQFEGDKFSVSVAPGGTFMAKVTRILGRLSPLTYKSKLNVNVNGKQIDVFQTQEKLDEGKEF